MCHFDDVLFYFFWKNKNNNGNKNKQMSVSFEMEGASNKEKGAQQIGNMAGVDFPWSLYMAIRNWAKACLYAMYSIWINAYIVYNYIDYRHKVTFVDQHKETVSRLVFDMLCIDKKNKETYMVWKHITMYWSLLVSKWPQH